jgi:RecA/RadA recombinase
MLDYICLDIDVFIEVCDEKIGNQTKVQVVKNKLAPPFRECEFDIRFGEDNNPETRELEREMKVGISPRRLLKAASQGEVSGVCRTTNSAFVGLLGELGAKNEEVRLVITRFYNDDGTVFSTHMHSELRNPHNETNWMKFDATPFPKQLSVNQESWIKELRTKRKEILPFITDFLIPKNY